MATAKSLMELSHLLLDSTQPSCLQLVCTRRPPIMLLLSIFHPCPHSFLSLLELALIAKVKYLSTQPTESNGLTDVSRHEKDEDGKDKKADFHLLTT